MGPADPDSGSFPRWAVVQHMASEGPGLIGEVLTQSGIAFDVIRTDRGDMLPDHVGVAGLVVMGGPMGVHDGDRCAWLGPERSLLAEMARAGKPVLGVCLGAQQLAAALGAEVTTGPVEEVGLGSVELTAAGRCDPVLGPEYGGLADTTVPCVHWHRDTFALPAGAVHLAATRVFPHQAFRWGDRAYGLQFHVEMDSALAAGWTTRLPPGARWDAPGLARVETVGRRILHRFVQRALDGAARPVQGIRDSV
jgi:GMP synthase-like glutamine amidotransferase